MADRANPKLLLAEVADLHAYRGKGREMQPNGDGSTGVLVQDSKSIT